MSDRFYAAPAGGLPDQSNLITGRAVFTESYAVIPRRVMRDIVTSNLPFWERTRAFVLARPLSGFAETFSWYLMEVQPRGGSDRPETEAGAEAVIFLTHGVLTLEIAGKTHDLTPGAFVYIPPGAEWKAHNSGSETARFHWIRKRYQAVDGIEAPDLVISSDERATVDPMPDTHDHWTTTRFVGQSDIRHDMVVNIVNFDPGADIPFAETHVMEHGIYILEGKGISRLNQDWVEVQAGDFLWLRAFCPQACYAAGSSRFRYLLYKDINRHMPLGLR